MVDAAEGIMYSLAVGMLRSVALPVTRQPPHRERLCGGVDVTKEKDTFAELGCDLTLAFTVEFTVTCQQLHPDDSSSTPPYTPTCLSIYQIITPTRVMKFYRVLRFYFPVNRENADLSTT